MSISLVVADDHPVILNGLAALFQLEPDIGVLARCVNGVEALAAVRRHAPDVLVIDLRMPKKSGLEVLRDMHAARLSTRSVILAAQLSPPEIAEAGRLGVKGIVLKDSAPEDLVECVRAVHAGREWFDRRCIPPANAQRARGPGQRVLTPREFEVVRLVASGRRNREIAHELDVTEGTVKLHLHSVYQKLGVESRVQLMLYAQERDLL